jgi:hypothetical protein
LSEVMASRPEYLKTRWDQMDASQGRHWPCAEILSRNSVRCNSGPRAAHKYVQSFHCFAQCLSGVLLKSPANGQKCGTGEGAQVPLMDRA